MDYKSTTFQLRIRNFSRFSGGTSSSTLFHDALWELSVIHENDSLGVFLHCTPHNVSDRMCAKHEIRLLQTNRSLGAIAHSGKILCSADLNTIHIGIGSKEFVSRSFVWDVGNGFICDDTVTFEATIKVLSAKLEEPNNDYLWSHNSAVTHIPPDCSILVGNKLKAIQCHRYVLMKCIQNPVVRGLLYTSSSPSLRFTSGDVSAVLSIIRFAYTNETMISPDSLEETLKLAHHLGLHDMIFAAFQLMTIDSVPLFFPYVDSVFGDSPGMKQMFWRYVSERVIDISQGKHFDKLTPEEVKFLRTLKTLDSVSNLSNSEESLGSVEDDKFKACGGSEVSSSTEATKLETTSTVVEMAKKFFSM